MINNSNLPAILGGSPLFDKPYHLVRPSLPPISELIGGFEELYESRNLTNQGKFVNALEQKVAVMLGVKHCALFCNGTIAIISLIRALDLRGEILVPSFTFAATVQALLWERVQPKFVDIDRETLTMDYRKIEESLSENTSAIFPVNIFGKCCEHDEIRILSKKRNLSLIYDSAQAFGTIYKGKMVGVLGDAEVFSFHATKLFHTGEGGAVVTNNTELYERLCRIRNFGFGDYLNCMELGLNGKMSEFSGIIGLKLLDSIPAKISHFKWIFQQYKESLKNIPGIKCPEDSSNYIPNYSYFYVIIEPNEFGLTNLELNYALMPEFIITRCYFYPPVHRTAYYQQILCHNPPHLPETDWASLHVLCLPVHVDMRVGDLAKIIGAITRCHLHAKAIKKKLINKIPKNWESLATQPFLDPHDKYILKKTKRR